MKNEDHPLFAESLADQKRLSQEMEEADRMRAFMDDFGFVKHEISSSDNSSATSQTSSSGLGSGQFANSLDFSDLRHDILMAMQDHDEVALSASIDLAH